MKLTGLKKLHAACTKLEHYPSRLTIQEEIERLLEEEAQQEKTAEGDLLRALDPTGELSQFIGPGWIKEILERLMDFFHAQNGCSAEVAFDKAVKALALAEEYLVARGIEHRGTVGRTIVLPAIREARNCFKKCPFDLGPEAPCTRTLPCPKGYEYDTEDNTCVKVEQAPPPAAEGSGYNLIAHLHRQRAFSLNTFGPGERFAGVMDHIEKECKELRQAPKDLEEWIDLVLLAFDGAWRAGFTPEQIAAGLFAKQQKNESRKWPDWKTAPAGKAIEHIRDEKKEN